MSLDEFEALPDPQFLLVLHGAEHAAVGENPPTPADEAYRVATTVFWDRCLGGHVDAAFPQDVGVAGVTTLRRRLVSSIGVFRAGRVGTKHSDEHPANIRWRSCWKRSPGAIAFHGRVRGLLGTEVFATDVRVRPAVTRLRGPHGDNRS